MNKKLEKELEIKYCHLGYNYSACSDGWFNIIESLLECVDDIIKTFAIENFKVVQIKSKFGQLRFYFVANKHNNLMLINGAIKYAEMIASKTCEFCGSAGTMSDNSGAYVVVCKRHAKVINGEYNILK